MTETLLTMSSHFTCTIINLSVWTTKPTITDIESMTGPIESLPFPAVTLCPKNPNPDRWGPIIKMFDYMQQRCTIRE